MDTNAVKIDLPTLRTRSARLASVQRELARYAGQLAWSVDALIPADPSLNMPSASQAGVLERHLPEALLLRDDMAPAFYAVLAALPVQAPADGLAAFEELGPKNFEIFSRVVAGAFFLDEGVNAALRYPGQADIRETPDYDLIMELIEPVIERGDVYTKV